MRASLNAAAFVLFGAVLGTPLPPEAAVRVCKSFVTGELAREPTEKAAKKRALESWTEKARLLDENALWRIAAGKSLTCAKQKDGSFACLARAYPCTIRQVPPQGFPRLKTPGRET